MVARFGSILGVPLTVALLAIGALVFFTQHRFPEQLSVAVSGIATPLGKTGYVMVLLGTLAGASLARATWVLSSSLTTVLRVVVLKSG